MVYRDIGGMRVPADLSKGEGFLTGIGLSLLIREGLGLVIFNLPLPFSGGAYFGLVPARSAKK